MSDFTGAIVKQDRHTSSRLVFLSTFFIWWGLLAYFHTHPELDLAVARLFFAEANCGVTHEVGKVCGEFVYDKSPLFSEMRNILFTLPYIAVVVVLISIIHLGFGGVSYRKSARIQTSIAALVSLALGCGLLVNLFLKTFSGRPRPRDTLLFGGNLDFVQAGSFAGKCVKNCSFISGEASSAGWLLCLILLVPRRWRIYAAIPLAVVSFLVPVMRVVTGAHYLSDAILAWLSSIVIFAGVLTVMEIMTGRRYSFK